MSAEGGLPLLLVVLPGAAGRRPVLQRLQAFCRPVVLVPSADLTRSAWAKDLVGEESWIQLSGTHTDFAAAQAAVEAWLRSSREGLKGLFSYDEFGVELAAHLGEALHLPCTPLSEVQALRNKEKFRRRCSERGVPAVRCAKLADREDVSALLARGGWHFPSVLKPAKGAGSWHVLKIHEESELLGAFESMDAALREGCFPQDVKDAGFLLEEYFAGHEVDVDGFVRDGNLEFCLVSDNRPALEPHFLELGGIYPSQLPAAAVDALKRLTEQVLGAFERLHCCFHFEAKIDLETLEAVPIEFNARCGGAECPASVEAVSGHYLPEVAARLALGLPASAGECQHKAVASTNVHVFQEGTVRECSGEDVDTEACKVVALVLFGAPGSRHVPNNGSQSCLGWLATGGADAQEAEENLEKAQRQLRVCVEP